MSFLKKVIGHARDEIIGALWISLIITMLISSMIGLVHSDRRHDDPEEIKADQIRQEINESHRFHSFGEERTDNFVKWYACLS